MVHRFPSENQKLAQKCAVSKNGRKRSLDSTLCSFSLFQLVSLMNAFDGNIPHRRNEFPISSPYFWNAIRTSVPGPSSVYWAAALGTSVVSICGVICLKVPLTFSGSWPSSFLHNRNSSSSALMECSHEVIMHERQPVHFSVYQSCIFPSQLLSNFFLTAWQRPFIFSLHHSYFFHHFCSSALYNSSIRLPDVHNKKLKWAAVEESRVLSMFCLLPSDQLNGTFMCTNLVSSTHKMSVTTSF